MNETHLLSVLVRNQPGVLARIAGLFSRRAFNIHSLAVGPTQRDDMSRITIVVAAQLPVEQVRHQLDKLVDVIAIAELNPRHSIARELVLITVYAEPTQRPLVLDIIQRARGVVVDVNADTITAEVTGSPEELDELTSRLDHFGIAALAQSGTVALPMMSAGEAALKAGSMDGLTSTDSANAALPRELPVPT